MPTLFLHVGAGKTGTSALQVAFAQNIEELKAAGVVYPADASTRDAAQGQITSGNGFYIARHVSVKRGTLAPFYSYWAKRQLNSALRSRQNLLYSSEYFQTLKMHRLNRLVEHAKKAGYETKIIYYVRSIAGHAASVYSQTLKRQKSTLTFGEFLEQRYRVPFLPFIERANEAAGRNNVLVYNFDAVRTDLFAHFLQNILTIDASKFHFVNPKSVNRSLGAFEAEFLRYLNGFFKVQHQAQFVSDALIYAHEDSQSEFTISPAELNFLKQRYASTVEALNEYVIGEKVWLCASSITEAERPKIVLNEFERSVLTIMARLIPQKLSILDRLRKIMPPLPRYFSRRIALGNCKQRS